jgi:starch-binding outer membrane protein, SusD/RagB family
MKLKLIIKTTTGLVLALSTVLLLTRCNDSLLDTEAYARVTPDVYWTTADNVVSAVNAIYEPLLQENYFGHFERTWDIQSDDMWRAGDHGEDQAIEEFSYDASNPKLIDTWKWRYEMISRANQVLIHAPDVAMDTDLKNRCMGEAYFLRGFSYWRHYLIHGEVPLILEEDVRAAPSALKINKPKASLDEMEAQIEADFKKAAELLPKSYDASNLGRVTQGTAYGFLAKLYLYTNELQKAIDAGVHVTEDATYALAPSFEDNFKIATENNSEILFSQQYTEGWTGNETMPEIYTTPRPWGGWDFREPIQDLIDEFEPNDPRLDYTVFKVGDMVDLGGEDGITEYTADLSTTGYHFRKFASWRPEGGLDTDQNAPILRAADVYLIVAEAKIRLGQNGDAELNAVRDRNGLDLKTNATMADIIHERRVELAGENERHQDLMRWDKAGLIDIVALYNIDREHKDKRTFVRPKHYYFPIPQREVDLSEGVLIQNENY